MSFVIQRTADRNVALTHVASATLRIGRGTNADLRSDNPAVAFEHAVIEAGASGYTIADKGSITGTYVNGKPVESVRLAKGDLIEVGDLRIEVQLADAGKPMFLRLAKSAVSSGGATAAVLDDEPAAMPGAGIVTAPRIDYAEAFSLRRSWFTKTTIAAVLLIITLGVIGEVTKESNQRAFMPGGLSSAHARARDANGNSIADRCSACHTPFRAVSDEKCQSCHNQGPHTAPATAEPACAGCHQEHRTEAKLASVAEGTCTSCHARATPPIPAFGAAHPDFEAPPDTNTLRFNHQLHLRAGGVPNGTGRRTVLQCQSCHDLAESNGAIEPVRISFDAHCRDCHRLTFDPRLPRAEVPHGGDPGLVYGFVMAMYAGNQEVVGKSPVELRRILSRRATTSPDQRAVLNAEQVLKTKCRACHDINAQGERLAVVPPVMRAEWFPRSHFSHGRHAQIACTDCHRAAPGSSSTADVLLPAKNDCTSCHAAGNAQAASTCVTCHDYHHRSPDDAPLVAAASISSLAPSDPERMWGGRMFEMILIALVVVLLFVVLIPMGMALYQRLKPAPPPAAPPRQAQAPRPAQPPAGAPPPPPPPNPAPAATQMISLDTMQKPEGAGTEMLQWYGMLRCTAGPLEGQHFIIEGDGFYIGRDATLSKVVINDSRISKRHVRIVPRNGRVYAIDEGSTNGTFLGEAGGERITEVQLRRGDKLVLADNAAAFVYQI